MLCYRQYGRIYLNINFLIRGTAYLNTNVMSTIKVNFNIYDGRIAEAIAEGKILQVKQTVEFDLDLLNDREKKALSMFLELDTDKVSFKYNNTVIHESKEFLLNLMLKRLQEEENQFIEAKNETIKKVESFLSGEVNENRIFGTGIYSDMSGNFDFEYLKNQIQVYEKKYNIFLDQEKIIMRAKNIQDEVNLFRENRRKQLEQEKAEREAAKIASEEKAKASKELLKSWALANGSDLLKARIEENLNWFEMANDEWLASVCPEGFMIYDEDNFDSCWDYNNPTLEHINEMREARNNTVFESVSLRKCREVDENEEKTFYHFVVGKIKSFDGNYFINVNKLI